MDEYLLVVEALGFELLDQTMGSAVMNSPYCSLSGHRLNENRRSAREIVPEPISSRVGCKPKSMGVDVILRQTLLADHPEMPHGKTLLDMI
jgi:hypothetical protein